MFGLGRGWPCLASTTRDRKPIDIQQRDFEAEATANVVSQCFGVQTLSEFYLASYRITPAMLLQAVETIAKTVKTILEGCQQDRIPVQSEPAPAPEEPALLA
jgi:hypothetical protein